MVNVENVKHNHLPSFGLDMIQVMLTTSNGIMKEYNIFNGNVVELLHKDNFKKKQIKYLDKGQVKLDLSLKFRILKIIHENVCFFFFLTQICVCCFFQVFINMSMLCNYY